MKNNKVFVITGATGVGKTTIARYLQDNYRMPRVITHTTRAPRDREMDGVSYYFENEVSFEKKHFLERVTYAGSQYGSSYEGLELAWQKNPYITIVLDTAGAITYAKELGEQAIIIFVTVTSPDVLVERVQVRGDDPTAVKQRVSSPEFLRDVTLPTALQHIAYELENDDWSRTKVRLDLLVNDIMNGRSIPQK
ncbi:MULTISPECIES: guanylate kinase [Leuconostoc]|uniref:Guanylate kinase n=2 Tax=Leuconostoc kimchii TaxID=136609 RepID=D5T2J9_LEUKI|nr:MULTISPECIES: guanylate kinase [Leuconostoc]ADG40498.1 guanylate kinase [Leuconostoc kimchii IMSNU 11154]AEJ31578.1 guanylate kinase [Leuconostoc sp. C2]QBR46968.1 guanylate kinase [Leuconostoc kimchii]